MIYSILSVFFTAAAPIAELRGAIPLGIGLGLAPGLVFVTAVLGNIAPVLPLLYFLRHGSQWAMQHSPLCRRILEWVFARTRAKHSKLLQAVGVWALAIFVAIPLPLTGAWTAVVIAYLVDMPIRKAFFAILGGVLAAGALVFAITLGVVTLF